MCLYIPNIVKFSLNFMHAFYKFTKASAFGGRGHIPLPHPPPMAGVITFWGPFHEFGDPQHNSVCMVDTQRFSGWHEFLAHDGINIAHLNAGG